MVGSAGLQTWLDDELPGLVAARAVPGASVAVLHGGMVAEAAAGVTSRATAVPVTTDTVFQIGSITKLWTATLVMQCVDDGLLDLDAPLRDYLPGFVLGDEGAAAAVTTRQVLCHTAGFEGDIFTETGRGEDAIEKYVASLGDIPQLFDPGELFSYNNTGYSVLGRLLEVLRGAPFDQVLLERLAKPLGLTSVSPSPYEAILHRAAVGHIEGEDGVWQPASQWALVRSNAAAGSMLAMTARDLIGFARMHLDGGVAGDPPAAVLRPESVAEMQARQATVPLPGMGSAWGLGWSIADSPEGQVLIGHTGGTIGQAAFLRVVPEKGLAIALLTNGGDFVGLHADVVERLLRELAGLTFPGRVLPPAEPAEVATDRILGTYCDTIYDIVVSRDDDGRLWVETVPKDVLSEVAGEKTERSQVVGLGPDTLIALEAPRGVHPVYAFLGDSEGRAKYVHYGRVVRRAPDPQPEAAAPPREV